MYFLSAPLHIYAIVTGIQSGIGIRCCGLDKSAWNSFQNTTSLIAAKVWALLLTGLLLLSVVFAFVNFAAMGFKIELIIGLVTSCMILSIIYEPVIAMFFHKHMVKYKIRSHENSVWVSITKRVCGRHMLITPKHVFLTVWVVLFVTALNDDNSRNVFRAGQWWPCGKGIWEMTPGKCRYKGF